MTTDQLEVLRRIDTKLGALLAIAVEDLLRRTPDLANPRPRSIDQLLDDVGMSGVEIAELLGKTPQAVSNQLARAKKSAKKSSKRSPTP